MTATPVRIRSGRPLAPMQRPLWVSQRRHPGSPLQNMALLSHIDGPVDAGRLADAFRTVVLASDVLRTRIVEEGGSPTVHLLSDPPISEIVRIERQEAHGWALARAKRVVDVGVCGYDSAVLVHSDGTASWYLALHHTVTDATSSAVVFDLTAAVYNGVTPELPSYYEWVASLEEQGGDRSRRAAAHWRNRPAAPGVGRLYQPARDSNPEAHRVDVGLDGELLTAARKRLGSDFRMLSEDLAWSTTLLVVAAVYLHRISRVDEFSLGLPVHNRRGADSQRLVGPTMEVFPVDVTIEPDDTFRSLHRRIGRSVMDTLRHAVPGTAPAGDYEAVVNVIPRAGVGSFGDFASSTEWIHSGATDPAHLFRLQLTAYGADELELVLDLNDAAAGAGHRSRAPEHVKRVLGAMLDDPDAAIAGETLCTATELEALVLWETSPDLETPPGLESPAPTLVEQLRSSLARRDDVAVREGEESWTGAELWSAAVGVARWLRDNEVSAGRRVGIELRRSADAVIAILATMIAGGSYVPLDPTQPAARRRRLADRAGCVVILDPDTLAVARSEPPDGREPDWSDPSSDDEAYLLFTSGSTGEPKGVPILHRGLVRYIQFAVHHYVHADAPLVVPLFSALTFDLTVTSLFLPLVAGGQLVVITDDGAAGLAVIARTTDLTWCKATPSHLTILDRLLPPEHQLATFVVGGEAFNAGLARTLLNRRPDAAIFNEYGPTEAVVGCMIHRTDLEELEGLSDVPIGRPAPGVTLRVIDDHGHRVPPGSPGELCIAHAGLTPGYLDGNDEAFLEMDGLRFYRSGDLVRLSDDHTLVYLGRIDEQMKVGGIRLDPTEIEDALVGHPAVRAAAVRQWSPIARPTPSRCERCGLASNVPGVTLDDAGVCDTCRHYERIAPVVTSWFRTPDDLVAVRDRARERRTGAYDCLHLLSGGKDSTYALLRLVELGFQPYAMTLDNGFISDQAKENVRRTVEFLGIDHEFVTTDAMNDIFRDSLERYSNVCNGCFKTIYTLGTARAVELGIPVLVTGLSRGQLFETRLVPQQFEEGRFDPEAIDRSVLQARKHYHRTDDGPNRMLDTSVFANDAVFEAIDFVDFYRYIDVDLADMLDYLDKRTPWVRPTDTGRSTNCRINDIGIHTHLIEQGYHNYSIPYAWDVRLGHKTRDEAVAELDDRLDAGEVQSMLDEVGYRPEPRRILTAWLVLDPEVETPPSPAELRAFLSTTLPAHAVPAAFVVVDELTITVNGKLDTSALPPPERVHRSSTAIQLAADTPLETIVVSVWEHVLGVEPIGVEDDFFAIGGDSLSALEMIVLLGDRLGRPLLEELPFNHTTPRDLAAAIDNGRGSAEAGRTDAPPSPGPINRIPGLSVGERSILFDHEMNAGGARYNIGHLYRVDGPVDGDRFEGAARIVAARHIPLSWTYSSPRRCLSPEEAVDVEVARAPIDNRTFGVSVEEFIRTPIPLRHGPLIRFLVQPLDDGTTGVAVVMHHVSGDAESLMALWDQIDAEYCGRPSVPLLTDYPGYTRWLSEGVSAADRAHWEVAADTLPASTLDIARPHTAEPDGFIRRTASFSAGELRSSSSGSAFSAAFAGLACVLARSSEGDRVGLGVIASTRTHPNAAPVLGYLLNTLPVIVECSADRSFAEIAARSAATIGGALAHRAYPLADIVGDRRTAGMPGPAIQVLLAFHELDSSRLGGTRVEHEVLFNGSAVADLTCFVEVHDELVDLAIEYRGSAMTRSDAERLLTDLDVFLREGLADPATPVGLIAVPSDDSSVLSAPLGEAPETVLGALAANVATTPDRPAVCCGSETITWAELGARSEALARHLTVRGVGRGDRVIVCLPRSVDLVVAIVGVLRAGAAYVPIDPEYPEDRIRLITELAGAQVAVVADEAFALAPTTVRFNDLDVNGDTTFDSEAAGDDIAYVIFTSGSTGRPRGVPVTHARLAASTAARSVVYRDEPDRFLVVSSASFDSSVAGLFWTLVAGGTVVLPTEGQVHDPDALIELLSTAAISHTLMVPTLYQALLERGAERDQWPEVVIVAGEACSPSLVDQHFRLRSRTELVNEYGPTEATVWATAHRCRPGDDPIPIGVPIPGAEVSVVDRAGRVRPEGVAGELVIGGAGVTDGYLDDADATAQRFTVGHHGERTFRTGDRAVVRNGNVWFLGRSDHQLNLGGIRVEPEEIEQVLMGDPAVAAAIVVGRGSRLVAHLEPFTGNTIDLDRVRSLVRASLPPAVRPSGYSVQPQLPRTPNGKLDRDAAALLDVMVSASASTVRSGLTTDRSGSGDGDSEIDHQLRSTVRRHFCQVLGLDQIGDDESFFELGGHSLIALELVVRLEAELGRRVTVPTVYEHPTVIELAAMLSSRTGESDDQFQFLVPVQPLGSRPPLFGVHVLGQNALFYRPLAERFGPDQPVWGLGLAGDIARTTATTDVREVSRQYADELERCAPSGPVSLAAVSVGSVAAIELARELIARGRQVALVALFDAAGPDAAAFAPQRSELIRIHLSELRRDPVAYVRARLSHQRAVFARRLEIAEIAARSRLGLTLPDRLRVRRFVEGNIESATTLEMDPIALRLTVFKATEDPFTAPLARHQMGWARIALGGVNVVTVPGGHLSMLAEPHVETLAAELDRALAAALGRDD